jgi:hypothetical protein
MTTDRRNSTAWVWWLLAIVIVGVIIWWIAEANDPDITGLQSEVVTLREGYTRLNDEFTGFREEWGTFREDWGVLRGTDANGAAAPEGAVTDEPAADPAVGEEADDPDADASP